MLKPLCLTVLFATAIVPSSAIAAGNVEAGKVKSALCQGCHGEDGNSLAPNFPKLSGQFDGYIRKQIYNFKGGERKDDTMGPMAMTLTEKEDIEDIAAYFSSQAKMTGTPSENIELVAQGEALYKKHGCIGCHAPAGTGGTDSFPFIPVIGGQHKDYIVEQFNKFRNGMRANDTSGTMDGFAASLPAAEVEAIAEYLSTQ